MSPSHRSEAGDRTVRRQHTDDGEPIRSFQTLLQELKALTKNRGRLVKAEVTFYQCTGPPLQETAFAVLGVSYRM